MRNIIHTLCAIMAIMAFSACSTTKRQVDKQSVVSLEFNADSAYAFCAAQCQFGPRTMNSTAHEQCAQWIVKQFRQYGYNVLQQKADLKGYDGTVLKSTNIIALAPEELLSSQEEDTNAKANKDPQSGNTTPGKKRIIICAHWDSRPWADNDPDSANWHKPVMAANDGASGVAVMLELARLLVQHDSARVTVDFICFDAEDWGIPQWADDIDGDSWALGAQHWASNFNEHEANQQSSPQLDQRTLKYDYGILLDMVGGQGAKFYRERFSMQYASNIVDKVWQAASTAGYGSLFVNEMGGYITDDHIPVNEKAGIPCIDIINHYPDCEQSTFGPTWHTINDDMQHIDKNTLKAVGQTLVQLLFE